MKRLIITVDNIKDVKPSEFVHSFISDIDSAGLFMEMYTYEGKNPCLGGQAARNLGLEFDCFQPESLGSVVARIGDAIRLGEGSSVAFWIDKLYPKYKIKKLNLPDTYKFSLEVSRMSYPKLKKQVMQYVAALQEAGI